MPTSLVWRCNNCARPPVKDYWWRRRRRPRGRACRLKSSLDDGKHWLCVIHTNCLLRRESTDRRPPAPPPARRLQPPQPRRLAARARHAVRLTAASWCIVSDATLTSPLSDAVRKVIISHQVRSTAKCWTRDRQGVHCKQPWASCLPTVCSGPLSLLLWEGWEMSSSLPGVGYGVKA